MPLELIQESDVDALLGEESLKKSLLAGIIGLGLVLLFMIAYYRVAGVVLPGADVLHHRGAGGIQAVPVTLGLSASAPSSCPSVWRWTPTS